MRKHLLFLSAFVLLASGAQAQTSATASYEGYSKYIQAVDEYVPAPGQFVNALPSYDEDEDDAQSMADKCTAAIAAGKGGMITLGAYGGYVTFHFDHSVANVKGQRDFYVRGNAFAGSSEPGIVMVSKDVNGNGLPDDPWYELSGSADTDSVGKVVYNYEITYTYDEMKDVPWTDNQGNSGTVERNNFHRQEYFPMWLSSPLTFKGTLLPKNGTKKGNNWTLHSLAWGYVDNLPNSDTEGNSFDISWAVDEDRNAVELDAIDFVRVYSAQNQMAGWLGETSTEVSGAEDLHLEASVDAMKNASAGVATFEDVTIGENGYYVDPEEEGAITSGNFRLNSTYYADWNYWSGFAAANMTDNTFVSYTLDQYKNAKGGGHNSANYGVAYTYGGATVDVLGSEDGQTVSGFYVNNSAWAVDAFVNGDGMTTGSFTTGDWFLLTITGTKADGTSAEKTFYLADYRSQTEADHYYIADWTWVDLSSLGAVTSLSFKLTSSRSNEWGMTTPSYFCIDDLGGSYDGTPTGIARPTTGGGKAAVATGYFDLSGKRLTAPQRGVNIIRMSDGTTRKVIVR